jgi:hypothetical protein
MKASPLTTLLVTLSLASCSTISPSHQTYSVVKVERHEVLGYKCPSNYYLDTSDMKCHSVAHTRSNPNETTIGDRPLHLGRNVVTTYEQTPDIEVTIAPIKSSKHSKGTKTKAIAKIDCKAVLASINACTSEVR